MTQLGDWEQPPHEDEELPLPVETTQEEREFERNTEFRDKGLISNEYYMKFLYETGRAEVPPMYPRVAELRMRRAQRENANEKEVIELLGLQPFRGCAKAKRKAPKGQTPKPKRVKASACTPQAGMKEARIRNCLSACSKHPNGHDISYFAIKQQTPFVSCL